MNLRQTLKNWPERARLRDLRQTMQGVSRCDDLLAWARERDLPCEEYTASTFESRAASRTIPEQLAEWFEGDTLPKQFKTGQWERHKLTRLYAGEVYRAGRCYAVKLPNATVHLPTGAVFAEDGTYFYETCLAWNDFFAHPFTEEPAAAEFIDASVVNLVSRWGSNYAHWLMDSLPRVIAENFAGPEAKLLVGREAHRFHRESLELLGFPSERIFTTKREFLKCRELICVISGEHSGVPSAQPLRQLTDRLIAAAGAGGRKAKTPYYIPRRNPSTSRSQRKIANEDELAPVLAKFGFETIVPDDLPFAEQIRLFTQASAIAGPHGAGIFNLLFAPPAIPVVELYNPLYWEHAPCRLTNLMGQRHHHLFGRNLDEANNFSIPPRHLEKLLALAFDGENLPLAAETFF